MKLLALILILMLSGCASASIQRDANGDVWKINMRGNGSASYEREGEKWSVNGKWTDLLKGIFQSNKATI